MATGRYRRYTGTRLGDCVSECGSLTRRLPGSAVLLLGQKQALEELRQTVQLLRCSEAKLTAQKELLQQKMQEDEGKEPPPVVNYEEDARSVNSMVSGPPGAPCCPLMGIHLLSFDFCFLMLRTLFFTSHHIIILQA